jgi:large subunit ribosomal protein L17
MRHLKRTAKLGRTGAHRNAMLANLVSSLIKHRRVTTTLAKAKAARSVAEKMVTLGKTGTIHARRLAAARLRHQPRTLHRSSAARINWRKNSDVVRILFEEIAPAFKDRHGGYTRIIKLAPRQGDASPQAMLEWVEMPIRMPAPVSAQPAAPAKPAAETTPAADVKPASESPASPDAKPPAAA